MKKFIWILVFVILAFSACKISLPDNDSATTTATTTEAISTVRTTVSRTNPDTGLQEYVPGNVELNPSHDYPEGDGSGADEPPKKRSYRLIYYEIPGTFLDYYGEKAGEYLDSLDEQYSKTGKERNEMYILSLIRHFNMSKEIFVELVEKEERLNASLASKGIDIDSEDYELYNTDIIYTFDNDIINEYYRRE